MRYIALAFSFLFLGARSASAHVGYVVETETLKSIGGTDFSFLFSPFHDINNVMIMLCVILMIGALYYLGHHIPAFIHELTFIKKQIVSYKDYAPWILRLGLGIMLMGAGIHGVLISPIAPTVVSVAALELIIGFCLLLGFLITPSLLIVIGFYLAGLLNNGYLFGSLEVIGSAIALFLLADSRPSFDHIVGIPMLMRNKLAEYAPIVLRIALGGAFVFLAFYEKIFNPHYFESVVESFNLLSVMPVSAAMWTLSVGIIELIVGLFLIFGFKTRITSAIAFFVFTATFFFFGEKVYSHVSIFAGLSALFILGGGIWSVDEYLENRSNKPAKPAKARAPRKISSKKTVRKPRKVVLSK
ncbi:MAG: DoxX family protein [Candidatus Pacebacteria bacterium]|nr:DoxX family protein [Candidatus Paceibacterota bacterium]MBP9851879.1 DoxX family protein [Candidatus Paceibacterota bacterium]